MTRIDDIRRRVEAATPGPWEASVGRTVKVHLPGAPGSAIAECRKHENAYWGMNFPAGSNAEFIAHAREDVPWLLGQFEMPVPMILWCPECHEQHVDAPDPASDWHNPSHREHLCRGCGHLWRPALIHTVGVAGL